MPQSLRYHTDAVRCLAFSCDGKLLVSIGDDQDHSIAVWYPAVLGSTLWYRVPYSTEQYNALRHSDLQHRTAP